jgi:putative ABC transport system ATP-binding protein
LSSVTPLVDARGLGRRHPNGRDWLLRDVSLALRPGERLAVVGPSGDGKTLLLRALVLLDPLDGGEILWQGTAVAAPDVPSFRRQAIYLHQRSAHFEGTVEDNLRMPFSLRTHRGRRFDRAWIVERLRSVGRTADFLGQPCRELSGGEAQLVALLRAVQLAPMVLLLDEPTASLDAETVEMAEQLVSLWQADDKDRAVVWVCHDRKQALRVADRQVTMSGGRLLEGAD